MNRFDGVLGLQVDTIAAALRAYRERRCRELLREAEDQAERLQAESRAELRRRVHLAIEEERRRRELALREAESRLAAAARQQVQMRYQELLDKAWPLLDAELRARWSRAETRREWCRVIVADATSRLGRDNWTIEYPADLAASETRWLRELAGEHGAPEPTLRADPELAAGLRILRQNARLDGSIDGILADRPAVAAALLAAWERSRDGGKPQ